MVLPQLNTQISNTLEIPQRSQLPFSRWCGPRRTALCFSSSSPARSNTLKQAPGHQATHHFLLLPTCCLSVRWVCSGCCPFSEGPTSLSSPAMLRPVSPALHLLPLSSPFSSVLFPLSCSRVPGPGLWAAGLHPLLFSMLLTPITPAFLTRAVPFIASPLAPSSFAPRSSSEPPPAAP